MVPSYLLFAFIGAARGAVIDRRQSESSTVPEYFQTTPQIYAGPTPTGEIAPFLAQTNPAPFGHGASYVPNTPLETALPISDNPNNASIFDNMGQLTTYQPNPAGFGVDEYPVPPGANISQIHMLHRHGSRYPTSSSPVASFGSKLANITANGTAKWSGELSFLNSWKYQLGLRSWLQEDVKNCLTAACSIISIMAACTILPQSSSQEQPLRTAC